MNLFTRPSTHRISEPYTHRNLAIYLLDQPVNAAPTTFLTLDEALQAGSARLHETGRVGELEIENLTEADLYAQAGDVVKGGWQDRALGMDFIVPHRSNRPRRMRVRTFCVERGRWNCRKGEQPTNTFKSASHMAASRELKLSIRHEGSQARSGRRWTPRRPSSVAASGATSVRRLSPSSLPLAVENEVVRRKLSGYVMPFANLLATQPEAAGFAFAINGRLNSADLYATPELFRKLWPKLLEAAALEALTEVDSRGATCAVPTAAEVAAWLRRSRRGRKTRHAVTRA